MIHTGDVNQSNAFKTQTRFHFIPATISLHQEPEVTAVEGERGQVFCLCPNLSYACELLSGNLRQQEGTANTRGTLPLALPGNGKPASVGPKGVGFSVEPRMATQSQYLVLHLQANCCGHVVFRKTEMLSSEHETFTCSQTNH